MQTKIDSLLVINRYIPKPEPLLESGDMLIVVQGLAAVIFIGLLVGLEREYSRAKDAKIFAGIRTFPLIAILGFSSALIASISDVWIYIAIFIGFSGLSIAAYLAASKEGRLGGTSEVSGMIVFVLGSLVYWGYFLIPAVIAIIIASFLSLKIQLHSFVGKLSAADIYATLKFAIITLIILPLLPDKTLGPLMVLNPRLTWYMVILVSGLSFIGYVAMKLFGKDRGIVLTGLLGGMVSSTAVTYSMAKKSKKETLLSANYATGVILASSVMFVRVLIIIGIINPELLKSLWLPLLLFATAGFIVTVFFYRKMQTEILIEDILKNPFELKSALLFGAIFGVIIMLTTAAQVYFGDSGIYVASALAGLSSVDAIVVTISNLVADIIPLNVAVRAIVIALIANTVIKILITIIWGSDELKRIILKALGIIVILPVLYLIYLYI
jgi:uncharacterized membrane protein (DUF4010 family)